MWGYFTLAASQMQIADLPPDKAKHLPKHPVPAILLARLALDQSLRGQGLGGLLLRDALARALTFSEQVGVFGIVVDAIDEEAVRFYQRFGFTRLLDRPDRLLIPIASIRQTASG